MFEVGFTEIILIFGIALLVLGPARLPKLAADLGRWAGRARAMARQLRTQLEQEARQFDPITDIAKGTGITPTASPTDTARAEPAQHAAAAAPAALPAATPTAPAAPTPASPVTTTTVPDEPKPAG